MISAESFSNFGEILSCPVALETFMVESKLNTFSIETVEFQKRNSQG
jgi:hypothetical protein